MVVDKPDKKPKYLSFTQEYTTLRANSRFLRRGAAEPQLGERTSGHKHTHTHAYKTKTITQKHTEGTNTQTNSQTQKCTITQTQNNTDTRTHTSA